VLAEVKKDGKVIVSSGKLSADTGKATFDGYIVNKDWAKQNQDFMMKFTKILAESDAKYRANQAKWNKDSSEVKAVAKWSGAKPRTCPRHGAVQVPDGERAGDQVADQGRHRRQGAQGHGGLPVVAEADREDAARLPAWINRSYARLPQSRTASGNLQRIGLRTRLRALSRRL
jgi:ABC-type nitrate/sulfonate/bicarbonate transport system substrate-binding protein